MPQDKRIALHSSTSPFFDKYLFVRLSEVFASTSHGGPVKIRHCFARLLLILLIAMFPPAFAQMAIGGKATVDHSGAAVFSIPVPVPPGVGGMQPTLSIEYSSQRNDGNAGVGWDLTGLSSITRCPRTASQDGVRGRIQYDWNDRYCLDGQRLVLKQGSTEEYRTEIDGFNRILALGSSGNGPSYFRLWTKDGRVLEYGNTIDSKIEAPCRINEVTCPVNVRVWALSNSVDSKANRIFFKYAKHSDGDFSISKISYGAQASESQMPVVVDFQYEARGDVYSSYHDGRKITLAGRLKKIATKVQNIETRSYQFSYNGGSQSVPSVLASIKNCAGASCLPETKMVYPPVGSTAFVNPVVQYIGGWNEADHGLIVDANGDGRSDFAKIWHAEGDMANVELWLSNGTGLSAYSNHAIGGWNPKNQYVAGDINGDGRTDIVLIWNNGPAGPGHDAYANVWLSTGTEFISASHAAINGWAWGDKLRFHMIDINGDGRQDLVKVYQQGTRARSEVWLSNGTGFLWSSNNDMGGWGDDDREYVMDATGDGLPDIVRIWRSGAGIAANVEVWGSNGVALEGVSNGDFGGSGSTYPTDGWNDRQRIHILDANADGNLDFLRVWNVSGNLAQADVWLSTGRGFTLAASQSMSNWHNTAREYPIDVNNDGRTDIVRVWWDNLDSSAKTEIWLSNGVTFLPSASAYMGVWNEERREYVTNIGITPTPEILRIRKDYATSEARAEIWRLSKDYSYVASSISNGIGFTTTFEYKPLTDNSVYTKDSGALSASYPKFDLQSSMYVVSSMSQPDGTGGVTTMNYSYGGLKADLTGRGVLGFRWMQTAQAAPSGKQLHQYTQYVQDWPYIGMVKQSRAFLSGATTPLKQTDYTYECKVPETGAASSTVCPVAPGNRYFPYAGTIVESSWDLNGVALPTTTTTTKYGVYGNATEIQASTSDGYVKKTINTYTDNTSAWILGRLTQTTVISTAP